MTPTHRDFHFFKRCLRIFWRGFSVPQLPYFNTRYCVAFGAGPVGFMLMRTMSDAEIREFNAKGLAR